MKQCVLKSTLLHRGDFQLRTNMYMWKTSVLFICVLNLNSPLPYPSPSFLQSKVADSDGLMLGLFSYPVLMAADILLYRWAHIGIYLLFAIHVNTCVSARIQAFLLFCLYCIVVLCVVLYCTVLKNGIYCIVCCIVVVLYCTVLKTGMYVLYVLTLLCVLLRINVVQFAAVTAEVSADLSHR